MGKSDLLGGPHGILNRWKFRCQSMNVRGVIDVRQTEIHTAGPLSQVPLSLI